MVSCTTIPYIPIMVRDLLLCGKMHSNESPLISLEYLSAFVYGPRTSSSARSSCFASGRAIFRVILPRVFCSESWRTSPFLYILLQHDGLPRGAGERHTWALIDLSIQYFFMTYDLPVVETPLNVNLAKSCVLVCI